MKKLLIMLVAVFMVFGVIRISSANAAAKGGANDVGTGVKASGETESKDPITPDKGWYNLEKNHRAIKDAEAAYTNKDKTANAVVQAEIDEKANNIKGTIENLVGILNLTPSYKTDEVELFATNSVLDKDSNQPAAAIGNGKTVINAGEWQTMNQSIKGLTLVAHEIIAAMGFAHEQSRMVESIILAIHGQNAMLTDADNNRIVVTDSEGKPQLPELTKVNIFVEASKGNEALIQSVKALGITNLKLYVETPVGVTANDIVIGTQKPAGTNNFVRLGAPVAGELEDIILPLTTAFEAVRLASLLNSVGQNSPQLQEALAQHALALGVPNIDASNAQNFAKQLLAGQATIHLVPQAGINDKNYLALLESASRAWQGL
ncbi:MAG: hypothetical protein ABII27_05255 [bacterium]